MAEAQVSETTQLLRAWANGDPAALEQLTPRVYQELRRIAGHFMQNERPGRTLQTTALVHEAYLRLIDVTNVDWQHRAHFFAVSATMMRRILLDRARKRGAGKRGGQIAARQSGRYPGSRLGTRPGTGCARRRPECPCTSRPAQSSRDRTSFLWRLERGRDR